MNGIYYKMYTKASFLDVLDEWNDIASDESISKAALAYRWIYFHSALKPNYGDGIVIGASGPNQLEQTVQALLAGPLSDGAANRVDALWEKVRDDSIPDNFRACFPEL
jgi:aflatoxin B1 aldehyde reductase